MKYCGKQFTKYYNKHSPHYQISHFTEHHIKHTLNTEKRHAAFSFDGASLPFLDPYFLISTWPTSPTYSSACKHLLSPSSNTTPYFQHGSGFFKHAREIFHWGNGNFTPLPMPPPLKKRNNWQNLSFVFFACGGERSVSSSAAPKIWDSEGDGGGFVSYKALFGFCRCILMSAKLLCVKPSMDTSLTCV